MHTEKLAMVQCYHIWHVSQHFQPHACHLVGFPWSPVPPEPVMSCPPRGPHICSNRHLYNFMLRNSQMWVQMWECQCRASSFLVNHTQVMPSRHRNNKAFFTENYTKMSYLGWELFKSIGWYFRSQGKISRSHVGSFVPPQSKSCSFIELPWLCWREVVGKAYWGWQLFREAGGEPGEDQ